LQAGFYHLTRPRTWGGYEFSLPDFLRVMREIARADMGTAWCLTLASGHNLQVASYWGGARAEAAVPPESTSRRR
jgi:3-hydroxy-9,10-secoandrosta-1,3,5(10)-triene-9,17-dione monooxygenase